MLLLGRNEQRIKAKEELLNFGGLAALIALGLVATIAA
jgi:hypothetical protein